MAKPKSAQFNFVDIGNGYSVAIKKNSDSSDPDFVMLNGFVQIVDQTTPESSRHIIRQLYDRICQLEDQLEIQRQLTEFCEFGGWTTVHGDKGENAEGFTLYRLTKDHATAICSVYPNSVLFIGRKNTR